ncbi:MAG: hypothetical protein ABI688_08780 [Bacteroidota bacterium]
MKRCSLLIILVIANLRILGQGCSDAGFCTAGEFNNLPGSRSTAIQYKNEIDIGFSYATHGDFEKFYQPQAGYRLINKNKSFLEFRLPFNYVKNTASGLSAAGIGDITATYNSKLNKWIDLAVGLRISISDASKKARTATESYPMYLQTGLGSTDLIAVANYTPIKFISIGAGIQLPLLQYNNNRMLFPSLSGTGSIIVEGYRRKPDALLRLVGHFQAGKLKLNGTILAIFHLADDHYKSSAGKYFLLQSKGSTYNTVLDISYATGKKTSLGFLVASPYKTRKNIPDGLARTLVISPKLTLSF